MQLSTQLNKLECEYEKQIIGKRIREAKNEQASTCKQSKANKTTQLIVCIDSIVYILNMCNLLAFLFEIEEIMHNRIS